MKRGGLRSHSYVMVLLFVFSELRWEMIVNIVDISGIVHHQCLTFLFIALLFTSKHLETKTVNRRCFFFLNKYYTFKQYGLIPQYTKLHSVAQNHCKFAVVKFDHTFVWCIYDITNYSCFLNMTGALVLIYYYYFLYKTVQNLIFHHS